MKPRTIFRIIIASSGLYLFFYGVLYLLDGLLCVLGLGDTPNPDLPARWYAVRGVIEMVLGLFVMRGIPPFLDLAFPEDTDSKPDSEDFKNTEKRDEDSKHAA